MFVRQNEVLKVVSNIKNLRLGRKYLSYYDYTSLRIDRAMRTQDYLATFTYNINGYKNTTNLTLTEHGAIQDYSCDCSYCNQDSGCAHVALAVFQLSDIVVESFPYYENSGDDIDDTNNNYLENIKKLTLKRQLKYNSIKSTNLIEYAKKTMINRLVSNDNKKQNRLFLELGFDGEKSIKIKLKVGNEKLYIIKNFNEFNDYFLTNEKVKLGKHFSMVMNENSFDEDSIKIFSFIKTDMIETAFRNSNQVLNSQNIDKIYDLAFQLGDYHTNLICSEIELKVHLNVRKSIDGYQTISLINDRHFYASNNHIYCMDVENFILNRINIKTMSPSAILMNEIINNKSLVVSDNDAADFYECFLNDSDVFIVENVENDNIVETANSFKVYADLDEQFDIRLTIVCNFNNEIKLGFDKMLNSYNLDVIEQFILEYTDDINYDDHFAIIKASSDSAFYFVSEGVTTLQQFCEVYISEELKKYTIKPKYDLSVGVKVNNNLLQIDINSIDLPSKEIIDMIKQYRKKKKFFRLKNGDVINVQSDEIKELNNLLTDMNINLNEFSEGSAKIGLYRSFEMEQKSYETSNISILRDRHFKDFINNFKDNKHAKFEVNKKYDLILREYQKEGVEWLNLMKNYGFGCILADDMGLGKTLQIISFLDSVQPKGNSIVVTPASLILNWESEINKFTDTLNYINVTGTSKVRQNIIANLKGDEFIITSYDYLRKDFELYQHINFEWIILDESQYIKNPRTQNSLTVKALNGKHKIALTGTPIENSLSEIWSIFDFLMPGYLYNYNYFKNNFEKDIVVDNNIEKQDKLKQMIKPFMLRRNKKEVLKELPDKIEHLMEYDFSEEEKQLYLGHLAMVNAELSEAIDAKKSDKFQILSMLTKLRQICCEPRVLFDNIHVNSSKLNGCLDIIENLRENNQKVLLFSSFTSVLTLIQQELIKRNISYYKLTGSTDKVERHNLVDKFQNDSTSVFLISLKSGGTGLNLTSAQAVIHFDPWWNISAQNQATDRAYRIGQNNNVQVFKLVMKDSIEQKIVDMQQRKKNLADTFVEGNEGIINKMSIDDMMLLFKV